MKLVKAQAWFNPFFVDCNGQKELSDIVVFDHGVEILHTRCGWFGSGNNPFKEIELNCDCVRKNKVDLNCKTAFVVRADKGCAVAYALYIPQSAIQMKRSLGRKAMSDNYYAVEKFSSEVVNGLSCETWHPVGNLYQISCSVKTIVGTADIVRGNLGTIAEALVETQKRFDEEKARLNAMSDEELFAESQLNK